MKLITLSIALIYSVVSMAQDTIVDKSTGVKIIFTAEGKIFPDSWYSAKVKAKGISLDTSEYTRSEKMITAVLKKYPINLIKSNLKVIYILKKITFYDQSFGGTNSKSNVYLSNEGIKEGYSDFYLEQLFHAEFSSILLRNNEKYFDELEWSKNNVAKFKYGDGGVTALKENKNSEEFDTKWNVIGFINEYATSSLENDFNSFAKNLFLPKIGFDSLLENYSELSSKRKLMIQFYSKLDEFFTEDFFNQIMHPTEPKLD
ncbi:MAG: hypothetical protein ACI837_001346 [Crocinitomicaceae bacterium]|jgi:hypothetical protein